MISPTIAHQIYELAAPQPRDVFVVAYSADVVLDNGAPYGDALLPLEGGGAVCAVSSVTAALLAQLVTAEIVRRFHLAGEVPPVHLSANVPGGDEHNHVLESRYAGSTCPTRPDRIRRDESDPRSQRCL